MKTILCVEDHPPAQLLMQAIVEEMTPHRLVVASTGAEARAQVAAAPPDLYIIDLDLPDTDGLTLARELTAQHPAPVILVSAYGEAVEAETLAGAVQFYLAKPLDPDDVVAIIHRALA
jgi:CheY-like chemotaxis protein